MCAWQIETGQPGWMRYGKTQNVTASIPPRFTFKGVISEHPRVRPEAAKALTRFVRAFVRPESALTWGKTFFRTESSRALAKGSLFDVAGRWHDDQHDDIEQQAVATP